MYIGNDLQIANPSYKIIDDISSGFNGSQTSFALQVSGVAPVPFPINAQQVMISVNGVIQEPDPSGSAGFKLLGSNIIFSSAPANGHAFFGTILAGADYVTAGSEFPDGSVNAPSFTFSSDQDTGWYRIGSGSVGYSANGVAVLNFDGNGLTLPSDSIKLFAGAQSEMQVFHDGASSIVKDTRNGGNVKIQADTLFVNDKDNSQTMLTVAETACTLTGNLNLANTKTIKFPGASSDPGATIKHQSGHFEINNDTGNTYFDTTGNHYLRTNGSTTALTLDSSQDATFAGGVILSENNAIHFRGAIDSDYDSVLRESSGNLILLNSRNDLVINIDSNNDSTDAHFGVAHGAATSSSTELFRVQENGRVGIGTASPQRRLVLYEATSAQTQIQFQNLTTGAASGDGFGVGLDSAEKGFLWNYEGTDTYIGGEGGTSITIKNDGTVGIGTTGPNTTYKTTIKNTTYGVLRLETNLTGADGAYLDLMHDSSSPADADNLGVIGFKGKNSADEETTYAQVRGYVDDVTDGTEDGYLTFHTRLNGSFGEKMRLDSAGRLLLGTTTEGAALADNLTIADSGDTGITLRSGTGSTGSLYFSDGTSGDAEKMGEINYYHGNNGFQFKTAATLALTLNSDQNATFAGNISCVTGTFFKSSGQAQVNIGSGSAGGALLALDGDSNGDVSGGDYAFLKHDSSGDLLIAADNPNNDSEIKFYTSDAGTLALTLTGANATFAGDVLIGRASSGNTGNGHTLRAADSCIFSRDATGETVQVSRNSSDGRLIQFRTGDSGNATEIGNISKSGSAVAYNTSSDYRLKENKVDISDGISRLKLLKPYRFNFKTEPSKTVDGFFAHEVTPAVPEAITGEKDGTEMQGIDQSKLVPLLVASLQEAIAKIEVLETKVAALESS